MARFAIVGYGPRGSRWHRILETHGRHTVEAVVDVDAAARSAARAHGVQALGAVTEIPPGMDGVIIATPPQWHADHVAEASEQDVALLIEKPLTVSLRDALTMVDRLGARSERTIVSQNFRFLRREKVIRELLGKGAIGPPLKITIRSARSRLAAPVHLPQIEHGPLWDICLHHLDALRTRFGSPPSQVLADIRREAGEVTVYSVAAEWPAFSLDYEHEENAMDYSYHETIEGERGTIEVDHQRVKLRTDGRRARTIGWRHLLPDRFAPSPDAVVLDRFVAVIDGESSELGVRDNLATIALIEAARTSLRSGTPAPIEIVGERP